MRRRTFLGLLGGVVVAAGGGAAAEMQADLLTRGWRKAFGDPERRSAVGGLHEVYRVGERFLAAYPEERSLETLVDALGTPADDELAWLAGLRDQITDDFADGLTVDVDGWRLARTEARAAALLALRR